jgi:PAS domain S-box-containing protein
MPKGNPASLDSARRGTMDMNCFIEQVMDDQLGRAGGVHPRGQPMSSREHGDTDISCGDAAEAQRTCDRLQMQTDILRNVRDAVVVTDLAGRITYWNAGATRLFGYSSDEMIGQTPARLYPHQEMPKYDLNPILEGGEFLGEWQGRRRDGSPVWVSVRASTMRDETHRPIGLIGVATDVTERRATADRLARLEAAVEQASDSIVIANASAEIEYVNPAFERISGYLRQDVIGRNPRFLKSGRQPDSFYHAMWATLTSGQPFAAGFTNRRQDGSLFEEEATISPIRHPDGEITGYVAVKRDVTVEHHLRTHAERLARERVLIADTIRGITGRETPEETAQAIARQIATLADVATAGLFIFELDGRTAPYGFVVASGAVPALRRVPRRRTRYLRARAEEGAWMEAWDDRPWHPYNEVFMRHGVRGIAYAPVRDGGRVIGFLHISSSAKHWHDQLTEQLPALVEFADIAGTLIGARVAERTEVAAARANIRRIVRESAFSSVFQPIMDLRTGLAVGYEALTRFTDGVAPDVRFAEAQEVGMGEPLEIATLRAAIEAAHHLPPDTWLNLNASPELILSGSRLKDLLVAARRPIVLEITEHAVIADYDAFRSAIERLGPLVTIAIDDAGAGYSSLHHVLELGPSIVKLDRGIIMGLEADQVRAALVAGMSYFGRSTGIRLIAEGVETEAELTVLRELDIDLAQGYLLGRPAPAADVRRGRVCPCGTGELLTIAPRPTCISPRAGKHAPRIA